MIICSYRRGFGQGWLTKTFDTLAQAHAWAREVGVFNRSTFTTV